MKNVLLGLPAALLAPMALISTATPAFAGPGVGENQPQQLTAYYVVPPGKEDEWLALYKKCHYPIVADMMKDGLFLSLKLYSPTIHSRDGWSFKTVFTAAPEGKGPKPSVAVSARIRKLFPDLNAYVACEKARWALTTKHYDEGAIEVDLNAEPLSIYHPDAN